ncbi:MAG TPA: thioredoxin domain-containing protein [Isosphaeraceae bacterium]|nr:thioredoxin domain-containing protein [Isosphaeraceae bacterium]
MNVVALLLVFVATAAAEPARDPVILDFHSETCGPCRQMRPAIDLLIEKGYPVKSIDTQKAPALTSKYHVTAVPAFIIVDAEGRELERTEGLQPAAQLAALYRQARQKARPAPPADEVADQAPAAEARDKAASADDSPLPRPWETVVRIRVIGAGMIGFGSGTIVYSSPEESIVLTCAHIFKLEGVRNQPRPDRFPRQIMVDLFDGKLQGQSPAMVHKAATVEGRAVDYDFDTDVGLIRIRPGRRLPASRVVPPNWKPKKGMEMIAMGCPEGNDATAWTTWVVNPYTTMRVGGGGRPYEAIECVHAPKQGRSGGGLYTTSGFVAGVCDFAEPAGNHGLYATPHSIYRMLDRHKLTLVYEPNTARPESVLAQNEARTRPRTSPSSTLRSQSPDLNEAKPVTMPTPEIFGIKQAEAASRSARPEKKSRSSWHPTADPEPRSSALADNSDYGDPDSGPRIQAIPAEIQIDRAAVADPFDPPATSRDDGVDAPLTQPKATKPGRWRAVGSASATLATALGE